MYVERDHDYLDLIVTSTIGSLFAGFILIGVVAWTIL
jgi:hypothetical protein